MHKASGFTRPFSPDGSASSIPPLPWHFAADQFMIHFRADPDALNSFIRAPLKPNPDRKGEAFLWSPNLNCHPVDVAANAQIRNPARTQYNVCVIAIPALFNEKPVLISAFQWCDKDWLVILSWMIGTCAKQAEFYSTGVHPSFDSVDSAQTSGLGTRFGRTISRNGERLISISFTSEEKVDSEALSAFTGTFPLLSERHIPDLEIPPRGRPALHDITEMILERSHSEMFVRGSATLTFNTAADNEVLGLIAPTSVIAGYRWRTAWTMTGIRVVHDYLKDA
jgi:hypothetical protein